MIIRMTNMRDALRPLRKGMGKNKARLHLVGFGTLNTATTRTTRRTSGMDVDKIYKDELAEKGR